MGLKILNGFRFPDGFSQDLQFLYATLAEFRKALRPVSEAFAFENYAFRSAALYDRRTIGLDTEEKQPVAMVLLDQASSSREASMLGKRSILFDYNIRWNFFRANSGRILMTIDGEDILVKKFLEKFSNVLEYSYNDSGLIDDGVSEAEWAQREDDWTSALQGIAPQAAGISAWLWGDYEGPAPIEFDRVLSLLPNFEKRVGYAGLEEALDKWKADFKTEQMALPEGDRKDFTPYQQLLFLRQYLAIGNSERRKVREAEIAKVLVPSITLEMLMGKETK